MWRILLYRYTVLALAGKAHKAVTMALRAGFLLQVCMVLCRLALCHAKGCKFWDTKCRARESIHAVATFTVKHFVQDVDNRMAQMGYTTKGSCPADQFSVGSMHGYSKCTPCSNAECPDGQERKGQCPGTTQFGGHTIVDGYYCEAPATFKCNPPVFYDANKNKYGCQQCPKLACAKNEYESGMCGFTRSDAECTCSVWLSCPMPLMMTPL